MEEKPEVLSAENEQQKDSTEEPSQEAQKTAAILSACRTQDITTISTLAKSTGGLLTDSLRQSAWPLLLGCPLSAPPPSSDYHSLSRHHDEDQVALDVNRSFIYYPSTTSTSLTSLKTSLSALITRQLRSHPSVNYFQGYHDIAQVLLLVLGSDLAFPCLERLTLLRIRDFCLPTLAATNVHLDLLPPILWNADPELARRLRDVQPFFALAATLTLFSHDVESYDSIARVFDYLLATPAVGVVYLFAAVVVSRRAELMEFEKGEEDMMHAVLSKLPGDVDVEAVIQGAVGLMERFPPEKLGRPWGRVSRCSVLKTTLGTAGIREQTLVQGEDWLKGQREEIETAERRKVVWDRLGKVSRQYRRPVGAVTLAVLVGVVSLWLGRGHTSQMGGMMGAVSWMRYRMLASMQQFLGQ